jgi:hypothetical protein
LDDVIENVEMLRLDENSTPFQSVEQLGPSQKGPPKWLTKSLESVHPDEVEKTGTIFSSKKDGVNVYNSNSGDVENMDVLALGYGLRNKAKKKEGKRRSMNYAEDAWSKWSKKQKRRSEVRGNLVVERGDLG